MKLLVYGAGVVGSLFAVRMHEAGHDVSLLARGRRLAALREHGVQLAEGDGSAIRRVPVPVVERPAAQYDLTAVFVRTQQIDPVLAALTAVEGDVLFMLNWAAGPDPLGAVIGRERVLLGFPTEAGIMDGDVIRYRAAGFLTRRVTTPIGEPYSSSPGRSGTDGSSTDGSRTGRSSTGRGNTARLERIVGAFRAAGINAKAEPHMDAWLKTHAAFVVPLGLAVDAAGGPAALAEDPAAVREMLRLIRRHLAALPGPPVPRAFAALQTLPEGLLVAVLRRFLRSRTAAHSGLGRTSEAPELQRLAEQMRAYETRKTEPVLDV